MFSCKVSLILSDIEGFHHLSYRFFAIDSKNRLGEPASPRLGMPLFQMILRWPVVHEPKLPEFCFTTCDCWFDSRIFEWHQNQILIAHVDPFCRTSPYRRKEVSQDSWMLLGRSCDAVKTERMWMREMKCFRIFCELSKYHWGLAD